MASSYLYTDISFSPSLFYRLSQGDKFNNFLKKRPDAFLYEIASDFGFAPSAINSMR
jgi:hypothetical protein